MVRAPGGESNHTGVRWTPSGGRGRTGVRRVSGKGNRGWGRGVREHPTRPRRSLHGKTVMCRQTTTKGCITPFMHETLRDRRPEGARAPRRNPSDLRTLSEPTHHQHPHLGTSRPGNHPKQENPDTGAVDRSNPRGERTPSGKVAHRPLTSNLRHTTKAGQARIRGVRLGQQALTAPPYRR